MKTIKTFLIDDHKLFVSGLTALLDEQPGIEVVGYSYTATEYFEGAYDINADVFMIDVNMPDMSGIDATKLLKEENPNARVLALSMYEDSHYIEKMIQSGAMGYMLKSAEIQELVTALREVAAGRVYFGSEVQSIVHTRMGALDIFDDASSPKKNELTTREAEVLSLIAREHSSQDIAQKLFISEMTVKTHRKNILAKTKTRSVVGLVKYAIRKGLVDY